MIERDDGIGEEEDAIGRGTWDVGREAWLHVRFEGWLKEADSFVTEVTDEPTDEAWHA